MSIQVVVFEITGKSPLLMHNPSAMKAHDGTIKKPTVIPTPEEEARLGLYLNGDGQLYVPAVSFRNAIMSAGVGKKIGKQTAWKMISCGCFAIETQCVLVNVKTNKALTTYTNVNQARVVIPKGGAVIRCRGEVANWKTKLALEIDDDFITPPQVLELFTLAGRMIGVMDWRPEKKGIYGRFSVAVMK